MMKRVSCLFVLFSLVAFYECVASAADQFVVKDGKANAEILIANGAPRMVSLAALELQYYIKEMSGARLPIIHETSDAMPLKIYVGKSEYTEKLGVNDKGLKYGAFHMVSGPGYLALLGNDFDYSPPKPFAIGSSDYERATVEWDKATAKVTETKWALPWSRNWKNWWNPKDYDAIMAGRYGEDNKKIWNPKNLEWSDKYYKDGVGSGTGFWMQDGGGSLNAVYAFLRDLGVRWYMPGEIGEIIPDLKTIILPKLNKTENPDFAMRAWWWYNYSKFPFEDIIWGRRLGMNSPYEVTGDVPTPHGLGRFHGRKEMQEAHPEYYALIKGKRDTEWRGMGRSCLSSKGLERECIKFGRFMFDHYKQPHISLFPEDGFRICECEDCKGKTASELVWGFVDRVARELYKTHPDRIVLCAAYTSYVEPPESIEKFTPNVMVQLCNRGRPMLDDPEKWETYWSQVERWKEKLGPKKLMRVESNRYSIKWGAKKPIYPMIHPHNMAKDLHALKGICVGEIGEQSQSRSRWAAPGCDHINLYVQARFLWDADQDVEAILDEYYEKFYGPAAKEMKEVFTFAEQKYRRTDKSFKLRCNPMNVSLPVKIKVIELLHKARETAGDTIYGKRIQVIIDELPKLAALRQELEDQLKKGNPREKAPVVEAYNVSDKDKIKTYHLESNLLNSRKPSVDTSFKVSWDKKLLSFDIRCEEPNMKDIHIAKNIWDGDSIVLLLESPSHSFYQIDIDPDGRIFDADRCGSAVTKWKSFADVKTEKGKDYWRVVVTIPVVTPEMNEGDPLNYVVGPEPQLGEEWYINIARRHPRSIDKEKRPGTYVLTKANNEIFVPDYFAKLILK
ncbi:DUF4838 domain-containing protein [Verrucomicrobiota bacterium]